MSQGRTALGVTARLVGGFVLGFTSLLIGMLAMDLREADYGVVPDPVARMSTLLWFAALFVLPAIVGAWLRGPGLGGCLVGMLLAPLLAFGWYLDLLAKLDPGATADNGDSIGWLTMGAQFGVLILSLPIGIAGWALAVWVARRRHRAAAVPG